MMFQILLHHFIRDIAAAPRAISDCPEVIAPIPLFKARKLRLQKTRSASLKAFDQIRQRQLRWILDVHMNVVTTYHARQYLNIFRIANLNQKITTSNFDVAFQNVIAILCTPNNMDGQTSNCVLERCRLSFIFRYFTQILAEAN